MPAAGQQYWLWPVATGPTWTQQGRLQRTLQGLTPPPPHPPARGQQPANSVRPDSLSPSCARISAALCPQRGAPLRAETETPCKRQQRAALRGRRRRPGGGAASSGAGKKRREPANAGASRTVPAARRRPRARGNSGDAVRRARLPQAARAATASRAATGAIIIAANGRPRARKTPTAVAKR